jgi:hypothetical protein
MAGQIGMAIIGGRPDRHHNLLAVICFLHNDEPYKYVKENVDAYRRACDEYR